MSQTKIEWADKVWNPITGCSHSGSPGCDHCWAKRMAYRLKGRFGYPRDDPFRVTFHPDRLDEPLYWKKSCRIFVCSMGDLFHGSLLNPEFDRDNEFPIFLYQIFHTMMRAKRHTFLILTKRPSIMKRFIEGWIPSDIFSPRNVTPNLWIGVSVENQQTADERIPILLQISAAKHFVSIEPILSQINLEGICGSTVCFNSLRPLDPNVKKGLDWIIVGAETGPHARPLHPDWVRSLVSQCKRAGVPIFIKQMGGDKKKNPIPKDLMIREFPEGHNFSR